MFKLRKENKVLEYFKKDTDVLPEVDKIDGGVYNVVLESSGIFSPRTLTLVPYEFKEKLVTPNNDIYHNIFRQASNIFEPSIQKVHSDLGVLNKLAIMLYGVPGTGKTSMCLLMCDMLCKKYNAICLLGNSYNIPHVIDSIRETDKNRNIIVFIDEFDKVIADRDYLNLTEVKYFLSLLDGEDSRNNFLFLTCLNDFNKIPKEFTQRPSRFKIKQEINFCDSTLIENYIETKIPKEYKDAINVKELVYKLGENSLTMDQVKTIVIEHIIEKKPIDTLIKEYSKIKSNDISIN
jgi:SpoVK/Ycf46/Vps4 family AAA+-type ATPase